MYNLNLLPPKLRKKQRKKIRVGNPTYAPFLLASVVLVSSFLSHDLKVKIDEAEDKISDTQTQVTSVTKQLGQINEITQSIADLKSQISKAESLYQGGNQWASILDEVSAITPPETTIESIKETTDGNIEIKATTLGLSNMARMKEAMSKNPKFISPDVANFEYKENSLVNQVNEISFTISTKFKNQEEVTP